VEEIMTLIIAFVVSHLSWFAIGGSMIAAYVAGHVHGTSKSAAKVTAAQADVTVAKMETSDAKADAVQAKEETAAVKNAVVAVQAAAAIPDADLDAAGKARGILRED
jgi:hypothetical protein